MASRSTRAIGASIFSIVSILFLGVRGHADSWDVYFCPSTNDTCECPSGSIPFEQSFDLQSLETSGKTQRCVNSSSLVREVSSNLKLDDKIDRRVPCSPTPTAPAIPIQQKQLNLPQVALLPSEFPAGCGYAWKDFNAKAYKEVVSSFLRNHQVSCRRRNAVNCTSATFLVFLSALKNLQDQGRINTAQIKALSDLKSDAWKLLNDLARPDLLMSTIKDRHGNSLGTGKILHDREIGTTPGWPVPGDFVQLWRSNLSGHSVIFQGYLKDPAGNNIGACYWSGNYSTDGYGYRCESLSDIKTMIIGRLDLKSEGTP